MASKHSEILLLSLSNQSFFDEQNASLFDSLDRITKLKRAKASSVALRYLEANHPKVILITDQGLTERKNNAVLEKVLAYIPMVAWS